VSDIDIAVADSLKVLDLKRPIREADMIGPFVGVERDRMRAVIVSAIDKDAADAHVAHVAEGDFLRAIGSPSCFLI
jgi:hypothetical protein